MSDPKAGAHNAETRHTHSHGRRCLRFAVGISPAGLFHSKCGRTSAVLSQRSPEAEAPLDVKGEILYSPLKRMLMQSGAQQQVGVETDTCG